VDEMALDLDSLVDGELLAFLIDFAREHRVDLGIEWHVGVV